MSMVVPKAELGDKGEHGITEDHHLDWQFEIHLRTL
jgi:hypothetical protein